MSLALSPEWMFIAYVATTAESMRLYVGLGGCCNGISHPPSQSRRGTIYTVSTVYYSCYSSGYKADGINLLLVLTLEDIVQQKQTEEGRRTYRPKRCGNNNKDEDNSPKTLNDKNQPVSSQKFRQLMQVCLHKVQVVKQFYLTYR